MSDYHRKEQNLNDNKEHDKEGVAVSSALFHESEAFGMQDEQGEYESSRNPLEDDPPVLPRVKVKSSAV